jgi:hypothetical protein
MILPDSGKSKGSVVPHRRNLGAILGGASRAELSAGGTRYPEGIEFVCVAVEKPTAADTSVLRASEAGISASQIIERCYNPYGRHSALDYQSSINYERIHYSHELAASPPPSTESG